MKARTPADVGLILRERRKQLGLDQRELADRIGASRQWVIEIEKGKPRAELGLVLRACQALGLMLEIAAQGEHDAGRVQPGGRKAKQPALPVVELDALIQRLGSPRKRADRGRG